MKLINSIKLIVTLLLLALSSATLAVEIKNFDIAGIKLGMTYQQAIVAVTQYLKVEKNNVHMGPTRAYSGQPNIK